MAETPREFWADMQDLGAFVLASVLISPLAVGAGLIVGAGVVTLVECLK